MTLVKYAHGQSECWHMVDAEDIVKSFLSDSLKIVSDELVGKYSIEAGDSKDVIEIINNDFDILEEIEDSDYAPTYLGDYIRFDEIKEDSIYFDNYTDTFFSGSDVLGWETEEYYWYHDGSGWQMKEISERKDIECILTGRENYATGQIETYTTKDGKVFKIDNSMYQGSIDSALEEYEDVIDEA